MDDKNKMEFNLEKINFTADNSKRENINENNLNEDKPISLKYQHFENYITKVNNDSNITKLKTENDINIKKADIFTNTNYNYIKNKKHFQNFSLLNSYSNYRNKVKTYGGVGENKKNNGKILPNIKDNNIKSLKNKILIEQKNTKIENIKPLIINKANINENIKIKSKTPNQNFLNKIIFNKSNKNVIKYKSRNQSNLNLIKLHSQNSEGYLGRKNLNGIPFSFEPIMVHNNIYSNKSEKKRHETILDEFTKLRQFIERQPENRLNIIKEFLNKYYIEYEKYSLDKLLSLCSFICFPDKNVISSVLKPYLDIKTMITELLNNIDKINNSLGIEKENDFQKDYRRNEIKEEIYPYKEKTNSDEVYIYSSPNVNENNLNSNTNRNTSENFKIKYYTKENFMKNKYIHRYEKNLTENEAYIKEIKSKLRDLEHQKKLHRPDKNYLYRNDLIIKDMNKEMFILKNNFEQTLYNRPFPIRKACKSQNNIKNFEIGKIISGNESPCIIFSKNKDKNKNLKKIEEEILNTYMLSKRINKNKSTKLILMKKEDDYILKNINKTNKSNIIYKYSMDEIIKRLYYKPMKIKFDMNEVRKKNKMTELFALELAKHNKLLKDINDNNYFLKNKNNEN